MCTKLVVTLYWYIVRFEEQLTAQERTADRTDVEHHTPRATQGYASVEYSFLEYREADLVRLDIRINGDLAPPLATVVHRDVSNRVY